MTMVPSWFIWITLTKHWTFGDWFHLNLKNTIEDSICHTTCLTKWPNRHLNTMTSGLLPLMSSEPPRKSTHFLYQYTSPLATFPSVLFYKERLYIFTQHCSKHWRGSPFTGLPHHHLVRAEIITIYFSSYSFYPTLISTSLFNIICHMAGAQCHPNGLVGTHFTLLASCFHDYTHSPERPTFTQETSTNHQLPWISFKSQATCITQPYYWYCQIGIHSHYQNGRNGSRTSCCMSWHCLGSMSLSSSMWHLS